MKLIILLALFLAGCAEPLQSPTSTPESPTATATERIFASPTLAENTPTFPAPTLVVVTSEPSPTPTPFIIEVTPLGGDSYCTFREAYFTPTSRMKLRDAANTNATIVGYLEIGQRVPVCDEVQVADQTWLCLDIVHDLNGNPVGSDCGRVVAYRFGETIFGRLEVVVP